MSIKKTSNQSFIQQKEYNPKIIEKKQSIIGKKTWKNFGNPKIPSHWKSSVLLIVNEKTILL